MTTPSSWLAVFTLAAACGLALTPDCRADERRPAAVVGADWDEVHRLLRERVTIAVTDAPLDKVCEALAEQLGVRVLIDETALDDLGIGTDEPVTATLRGVTLRAFLEESLAQLELAWVYRNECLIITTEEEAETRLVTRVYPIGDFLSVAHAMRTGSSYPPADGLIDTIVSTVASETWAENGGGEAEVRPLLPAQALVISQTQRVHLEIERLLRDLRLVGRRQGLDLYATNGAAASPPRRSAPRTYVAPAAPASNQAEGSGAAWAPDVTPQASRHSV